MTSQRSTRVDNFTETAKTVAEAIYCITCVIFDRLLVKFLLNALPPSQS